MGYPTRFEGNMPTCYLLAVAEGSSLDQDTNTFSLFRLLETVTVHVTEESSEPIGLPLEVHAYWMFSEEEQNREYEFRLVLEDDDSVVLASDPFKMKTPKSNHRVRIRGIQVPKKPITRIQVEWTRAGTIEWQRERAWWPLNVRFVSGEPEKDETGDAS
jgi:hypothetical protein